MGSDNEGSEIHYNRDGKGDQAYTQVPSTPQQGERYSSTDMSMPPKNPEAAGFGSDTSLRNETSDNQELDRVEAK